MCHPKSLHIAYSSQKKLLYQVCITNGRGEQTRFLPFCVFIFCEIYVFSASPPFFWIFSQRFFEPFMRTCTTWRIKCAQMRSIGMPDNVHMRTRGVSPRAGDSFHPAQCAHIFLCWGLKYRWRGPPGISGEGGLSETAVQDAFGWEVYKPAGFTSRRSHEFSKGGLASTALHGFTSPSSSSPQPTN